jgi:tetratricopeptide (TPR) repeat protein
MTQPFSPTPDMLAILAEIEANPRSTFLKLPVRMGNPGTFAETLTGSETFLTSAEKKLVRSYRDELETWLYYRAMRLMAEAPGVEAELLDAEDMLSTASSVVQVDNEEIILGKFWQRSKSRTPLLIDTARDCIQTGLRLIALPSTQVLQAVEAERAGRFGIAHAILVRVLHSKARPEIRAYAANNLGWLYWKTGDYASAGEAYRWAAILDPALVAARVFSLVSSGIAGDVSQVNSISRQLEELRVCPLTGEGQALIRFCEVGAKKAQLESASNAPRIKGSMSGYSDIAQAFLAPYISAH